MSRRFFIEPGCMGGAAVELPEPLSHRLARVLRLRPGDEIRLFDGSGLEVRAQIDELTAVSGLASIIERGEAPAEPGTHVHVYQSITKGERFEWLVEKLTEIGVGRVTPLITERSVVRTGGEGNKLDRWRRIAIEAAEQCGRGAVPTVEAPMEFSRALDDAPGMRLLPFESAGGTAPSVQDVLTREIDALFAAGAVSVFIGPEGGFTYEEVDAATGAGATIVTLGDRVLRSETAGLVTATLVMSAIGELG